MFSGVFFPVNVQAFDTHDTPRDQRSPFPSVYVMNFIFSVCTELSVCSSYIWLGLATYRDNISQFPFRAATPLTPIQLLGRASQ